ncbi:MAG: hypothetical protein IPG17_27250 [Sandaracinaceae bacterium]|nr:hypothetical protein [Sandaracinaceae bacterium]
MTQSASGAWTVDLACEGVSEADAALVADEAEDLCLGLGLNAEYCVDFGEETALALSEINEDLLEELIPEQLQFTVTNTSSGSTERSRSTRCEAYIPSRTVT